MIRSVANHPHDTADDPYRPPCAEAHHRRVNAARFSGTVSRLTVERPAVVLTSNPEDMVMLCGNRVRVVKV